MTPLSTQHFSDWTGGQWIGTPPESVEDLTIDTRKLESGQMFVAIKSATRDGHDFVEQAKEAGASAVLVSKAQPQVDIPQLVVSL